MSPQSLKSCRRRRRLHESRAAITTRRSRSLHWKPVSRRTCTCPFVNEMRSHPSWIWPRNKWKCGTRIVGRRTSDETWKQRWRIKCNQVRNRPIQECRKWMSTTKWRSNTMSRIWQVILVWRRKCINMGRSNTSSQFIRICRIVQQILSNSHNRSTQLSIRRHSPITATITTTIFRAPISTCNSWVAISHISPIPRRPAESLHCPWECTRLQCRPQQLRTNAIQDTERYPSHFTPPTTQSGPTIFYSFVVKREFNKELNLSDWKVAVLLFCGRKIGGGAYNLDDNGQAEINRFPVPCCPGWFVVVVLRGT